MLNNTIIVKRISISDSFYVYAKTFQCGLHLYDIRLITSMDPLLRF